MTKSNEKNQQYGSSSLAPYFVEFVRRIDPGADQLVFSAVDMLVRASEAGNVCLPLFAEPQNIGEIYGYEEAEWSRWSDTFGKAVSDRDTVCEKLLGSTIVGKPGELKPLIIDLGYRLYLYRYWKYEKELADFLLTRAQNEISSKEVEKIGLFLNGLFPAAETIGPDWQKIACATAFLKKFCVICGGPGTGKTSTVVKFMALLVQMAGVGGLKFGLAAPTGKAAARLQDSIQRVKSFIKASDDVVEAIPDQVQTIHRLLGFRRNSPYFRHNRTNPLDLDVLIVDEASMVDLALMAKLFAALPGHCRILLLGDKDQLASVEAGRVLGDICGKDRNSFSREFALQLAELGVVDSAAVDLRKQAPLSDAIVILQKSYRFDAESGIGTLAKAINCGSFSDVSNCLVNRKFSDICYYSMPGADNGFQSLIDAVSSEWTDYLQCSEPEEAFVFFEKFRLLCVHRKGHYGAKTLNSLIEERLSQKGLISHKEIWYVGRPVLITKNDYILELFNGDTGIALLDGEGNLRVFFLGQEGAMRSFSPSLVPAHETAFAVTVHKSQGSEFDHVALLLPKDMSPVLCRELLYTAVTRARKKFTLWGDTAVLQEGLARKIQRSSGLAERLYGELESGNLSLEP